MALQGILRSKKPRSKKPRKSKRTGSLQNVYFGGNKSFLFFSVFDSVQLRATMEVSSSDEDLIHELPKYTARALGENELLHGASFPGTYTVLLPSSLLHEAVPVFYTSLAGHSHLCTSPSRNGAERELQKTRGRALLAPYLLQNKHYENSLVNLTYAGASCPLHLDSPVYYWHVTSVFHCFFKYDIIAWPDVGS